MSDRMTAISLPYSGHAGLAEYGRETKKAMIERIRSYATEQIIHAAKILEAADEDFLIETYVGAHVQKNREIIQTGRKKPDNA